MELARRVIKQANVTTNLFVNKADQDEVVGLIDTKNVLHMFTPKHLTDKELKKVHTKLSKQAKQRHGCAAVKVSQDEARLTAK